MDIIIHASNNLGLELNNNNTISFQKNNTTSKLEKCFSINCCVYRVEFKRKTDKPHNLNTVPLVSLSQVLRIVLMEHFWQRSEDKVSL